MIVTRTTEKGVTIKAITGADLPLEAEKNVAGVAALAMMHALELDFGIEIIIHKRIKAGSGIGSSAASAAGAVVAINELLANATAPQRPGIHLRWKAKNWLPALPMPTM